MLRFYERTKERIFERRREPTHQWKMCRMCRMKEDEEKWDGKVESIFYIYIFCANAYLFSVSKFHISFDDRANIHHCDWIVALYLCETAEKVFIRCDVVVVVVAVTDEIYMQTASKPMLEMRLNEQTEPDSVFFNEKKKNAQRIGRAHFVIDSHIHIDAHPTHGGLTANGANGLRSRNTELEEIPEKRLQILFIILFFLFPFVCATCIVFVSSERRLATMAATNRWKKIINSSELAISYACKSVSVSWPREQAHMHGSPVNGKFFCIFCSFAVLGVPQRIIYI